MGLGLGLGLGLELRVGLRVGLGVGLVEVLRALCEVALLALPNRTGVITR